MTPESPQWPMLTINILAYNRREEVRQTLRELQSVDYPREQLEILVVDNASSDGTREMVESEFPDVKLLVLSPNCGVAGWNAGFEEGRGDFFLVLDDDSSPKSGLKDAVAHLQQNPQIGILACQIDGSFTTKKPWVDGQELIGFIGCGAIIRREVIEKIGGYAPWIHLYAHEWEYGVRCLEAGFDIRYFKNCIVQHRVSLINRSFKRACTYGTRNELLIIHKYFARQRPLLMARTLFHIVRWTTVQGWPVLLYVLRGVRMYLQDVSKQKQTFVKPEVQQRYVRLFEGTQPVFTSLFSIARNRLHLPGRNTQPELQ